MSDKLGNAVREASNDVIGLREIPKNDYYKCGNAVKDSVLTGVVYLTVSRLSLSEYRRSVHINSSTEPSEAGMAVI